MFPKEHGAYGQLFFPIATAFAIGHITLAVVALALASVFAFIAHEPLLILMGQRGPRAARDQRSRAWRWLTGFGGAALICGALALVTLPALARRPLALTAILAVSLAAFLASGREHTILGESCMSLTMGSFAAPLVLAAGASGPAATTTAVALAIAFVVPTVAVHTVIAVTRKPPANRSRIVSLGVTALAIGVASVAVSRGIIAPAAVWAIAPACAAAATLAIAPPSARRLRVVGWTLVATSTAAAVALILSLRGV